MGENGGGLSILYEKDRRRKIERRRQASNLRASRQSSISKKNGVGGLGTKHPRCAARGPNVADTVSIKSVASLALPLDDRINRPEHLSDHGVGASTLFEELSGEAAMLQRILIAARSARAESTAVHATARFSPHRRSLARSSGTRFRSATPAGEHGNGIARVITPHLIAPCERAPDLAPARAPSPPGAHPSASAKPPGCPRSPADCRRCQQSLARHPTPRRVAP